MRERLIGALVLVAIIVLLVPAVLKGPESARETPSVASTRRMIVPLDDKHAPARDEVLMPEPAVTQAQPPPAPLEQPAARDAATTSTDTGALPAEPPVTSKPAAEPHAVSISAATPAYAVQLGAFSTREKAESLVADLRKRGYSAFVLEYRASGLVLHRVRVGPEQDRARAVAIADRLRKDGFQPVVAPHP